MSKPIVFHLVSLLTINERVELCNRVLETNRKPLKNLLDIIIKSGNKSEPTKEVIFLKTFGKKYSEKQDGQLRNEYTHLKKIVEAIMAMTIRNGEIELNPLLQKIDYLKYVAKTNDYELFEKEAEKIITEAEQRYDYTIQKTVYELYTTQVFPLLRNDQKLLPRYEDLTKKHLDNVVKTLLHEYRVNMNMHYMRKRMPSNNHQDEIYVEDVDAINFEEYEDEYTKLAYQKVLSNTCWGEKRIQALLECFRLINLTPLIPNYNSQKYGILNNLAACYAEEFNYVKADKYFVEINKIIEEQSDTNKAILYCNYASNLIHIGQYDAALEVLNTHEKLLAKSQWFGQRVIYIKASAYAHKGMPEMLRACLPTNFSGFNKYVEIDCRFFICISYYLERDFETAWRESNNLYKTIYEQKEEGIDFYKESEVASKHFLHFFAMQREYHFTKDKNKLTDKLLKLKALTDGFKKTSPKVYGLNFYQWLVHQLDKTTV